ncbi:ABC transporter permease [Polaromonas sp. SM01]|uniref:ABC transporter permease n=1 Tax=Polaromonas sp. SM01 TaxID=3085630 RepID=UPI0029811617|nr:ABC transporter permease subunit [Polaromonas sp. SM01]MDW5441338.1 ABC transporter permease subunit [Polaromonas sp. SM01]
MAIRFLQTLRALVFPALLLITFEWWVRGLGGSSDALAPPSAAFLTFLSALQGKDLWQATGFTLGTAGLGLLLGAGLGMLLGVILGLSPRAARMSFLSVEVLRPVPSVALIPLAMLVFGFGLRMELCVVAFATFWPMLILSQAAARQVEPTLLEVANALGLGPVERVCKIVIPAMVPRLFVALRLGVAIALVVAVTVEIAANPHGMGYAMMIAQQSMDPALMLAWLFWIGLTGFAINAATLYLQQRLARHMGAL